ncbi:MAG: hypothetical protein SFU27_06910 [Thermonemataceae bacterium]|nr:hypothetical protein [Thermonemataceae bacterium]
MILVSYASVKRDILPENMKLSNEGNEDNKLGYPYKLARLVEGKRPYVLFYVWSGNRQRTCKGS